MRGAYACTPETWPLLAAAILIAVVGVYSWRHRNVPGAKSFAAGSLFAVLWLLGALAGAAAVAVPTKIAWNAFETLWAMPTVTAMTCFALEYAGAGRWLTRRNVALLSIPPLLTALAILTNDLHHAMWRAFAYDGSLLPVRGIVGWVSLAYGWGLVLVNLAVFVWLFLRAPRLRFPVALMMLGQVAGRGIYLLEVADLRSVSPVDPFVLAVLLPFATYVIALFGFRIFDPLQAAHRAAIEQMREGMVVFDAGWRVVSLNPAAESILGVPAARARGKTLREILPGFPDPGPHLFKAEADLAEISQGSGPGMRHYAPSLCPLENHCGDIMGYLLLLRDTTEQHQAQAEVMERQWAQATLQERVMLADELHDGLSQNLAFVNLQAQAAQFLLHGGQGEAAQASLDRLVDASREMQGDIRELIGNLLTVSLPSEGFCVALRQAVARFEKQNDLPVRLEISGDARTLCGPTLLPPGVGVQLLRIVQEALANVRKHAGRPSEVAVRLTADAGCAQLVIADNGAGFDSARVAAEGNRYGLQVMAQRAERIGGQVTVRSAPGQGTRVEVRVPLAHAAQAR